MSAYILAVVAGDECPSLRNKKRAESVALTVLIKIPLCRFSYSDLRLLSQPTSPIPIPPIVIAPGAGNIAGTLSVDVSISMEPESPES